MLPLLAVGLQLEAGANVMQPPRDDTYVEYALPHTLRYNTLAFGAGLKLSAGADALVLGWRNLGNQHLAADIIYDGTYATCKSSPSTCPAPTQHWLSGGNEQQVYAEFSHSFRGVTAIVGLADNRIAWHSDWYSIGTGRLLEHVQSRTEQRLAPYIGFAIGKGALSVGVLALYTKPNTEVSADPVFPGQGTLSLLTRITWSIK